MEKTEHAPWCFVGDCGIYYGHNNGIEGDEAEQVRVDGSDVFFCECDYEADDGQDDDDGFCPDGAIEIAGVEQHFEVVIPGVDVEGVVGRPVEIDCVGAQGIKDSNRVFEEGREEQNRDYCGGGESGEYMGGFYGSF